MFFWTTELDAFCRALGDSLGRAWEGVSRPPIQSMPACPVGSRHGVGLGNTMPQKTWVYGGLRGRDEHQPGIK